MSEYAVGNRIRCFGEFEDMAERPIDPTTVSFKIKDPLGYVIQYTYGTNAEIVRDGVGNYHVDVDVDVHGVWFYRFYSDGTGKAADEKNFTVQDSEFD